MKNRLTFLLLLTVSLCLGQVDYNAQTVNPPYQDVFRPGNNLGYFPLWNSKKLGDLVAGNDDLEVMGVGAKTLRAVLAERVLEIHGYDVVVDEFEHWQSLGMDEFTGTLLGPVDWHRDQTEYCPGHQSEMFANLHTPIWDDGANGTPYNDDNYFAAYVYKTVTIYNEYVRFWEIWNEPAFDLTGNIGWREAGDPEGNWWDNDPDPCDYILRAPIEDYIRTVRIAYEIIETIAPEDFVTVAGFGYQSFMDAFLRNTDNPNGGSVTPDHPHGGGAYFEIMGLHSYPHIDGTTRKSSIGFFERHSDRAAEGLIYRRDFYQEILDEYGYDGSTYPKKNTIATEMNAPREYEGNENYFASTLGQRNYIMKCYATAITNDVYTFHVYSMSDKENSGSGFGDMGMYKDLYDTPPYEQEMNDEGIAMKTTSDMLWGTTYDEARTAQMNVPDGLKGHAFSRPDGKYLYMLWAETVIDQSEFAEGSYSFPSSFEYNSLQRFKWNYSVSGNSSQLSPNNIALDATPIFLLDDGNNGSDFLTLNCPDDIFIEIPFGSLGGTVNWNIPTATTNCNVGTVNINQTNGLPSGSVFPLGSVTIEYSAFNGCNQNATCSFTVTIVEGEDPNLDCEPGGEAPWNEYIRRVIFSNIDNISGKCDTDCGYGDFTDLVANVNSGISHSINLTPGISWPGHPADLYWRVWIDYNDDGDFTDSGELAFQAYGSNQVVDGNIAIPGNVPTGLTKMRIAAKKGSYATPCEVFAFGEVEDYSINITSGNCTDNDEDGYCVDDDCDDNDPSIPAPVGSTCDDNNPETTNDQILEDGCTCLGVLDDECNITVTTSGNTITVTGLTGEHNKIKILDSSWSVVFTCLDNCDDPSIVDGLADDTYLVAVRLFDENWEEICEYKELHVIDGSGGAPTNFGLGNSSNSLDFKNLKVFPNPSDGNQLFVNAKEFEGEAVQLILVNIMGEVVQQLNIDEVYEPIIEWNMMGLHQGTYFITLKSEKKNMRSMPVLILINN